MFSLLLSRVGSALVVVLGVCTLVFLLIHLIPGDPVEAMLGESAQPSDREALRAALGLDRPIGEQYLEYLRRLTRLDLGESFQDGPLLILVFSLWLGWTPVSGREGLASLVLPAITLGTGLAAILARMVRGSVLEVLEEDYVRTARAKGLSEDRVLWGHALRNAWLPILTVIGLQLGGLLGGAVITETVFAWPGVGSLLVEAIQSRDYPVVQACVLLISLTYVLVNTLTDLVYTSVDPRIRWLSR